MNHNIRRSCCRLIWWQRAGQFRIHDRKFRAEMLGSCPFLKSGLFIIDHGIHRAFGSGCRDRQDCSDRKCFLNRRFLFIEIPEITIIASSCSNCFGRVDRASATYGKNKIDTILCLHKPNHFVDLALPRQVPQNQFFRLSDILSHGRTNRNV